MRSNIETFSSVLIANRGEIACRIIKTAKKCHLRTIAIYTSADQDSPHVELADQSILIGDGPIVDSYLSIPKIINAALSLNVEAIHPGYGFLSENADFATACEKNNIIMTPVMHIGLLDKEHPDYEYYLIDGVYSKVGIREAVKKYRKEMQNEKR